jgi:hypothetical protein
MRDWIRRACGLTAVCLLVACGGGGGGGTGTAAAPGAAPGTPAAPDPNAVILTIAPGEPPAIGYIPLTIDQAGGAPYAGALSDDPSLVTALIQGLTPTTGRLVLSAVASHAPGTFNTTVRAIACNDSRCQAITRTQTYPVSVTILPPLAVSPASVSLAAAEAASAQLDVGVSTPGTGTFSATVSGPASGWLDATVVDARTLRITASAGRLAPGVQRADVSVAFTRTGGIQSQVSVPVTFTVGKGLAAPAAQQFKLDALSTQASLTGSVVVRRSDDAALAWSASSSAPWLVLSPASASTPAALGYSVDLPQAASLKNFADHTATVTINAGTLTPVSFTVVLQKRLPFVASAMPYGIPTDTVSRVVLGGGGFTQYADLAAALQAGGLPVSNVQVMSDTQVSVNVRPPGAGTYAMKLPNASASPSGQTVLKVAAFNTYAAGFVAHTGDVDVFVHDPVRQAVFALSQFKDVLYRYQNTNGSWSVSAMALQGGQGMALAPDGSRLLVTTAKAMLQVDPDALKITATYPSATAIATGFTRHELAITSDGRAWLPTSYAALPLAYFDLRENSFGRASDLFSSSQTGAYAAPADGSILLAGPYCCGAEDWWIYDPKVSAIIGTPIRPPLGYAPQMNMDGSVLLTEGSKVYNRNLQLVGQVAPVDKEFIARNTLTPDGRQLIGLVLVQGPASTTSFRIDVYDTTTFTPGTTNFPLVRSIPIATPAASCGPTNPSGCDPAGALLVALDQRTLFWIGNQGMQVFKLN